MVAWLAFALSLVEIEATGMPSQIWRDGEFNFNDYLIESLQVGVIEIVEDDDEDE